MDSNINLSHLFTLVCHCLSCTAVCRHLPTLPSLLLFGGITFPHLSLPHLSPGKSSPKPVPKRVKADRKWDGVVSKEEAATLDCSSLASQDPNGTHSNGDFQPDVSYEVLCGC